MIAAIMLIALLITTNTILVWYIKRLLNIISDTTEGIKDMNRPNQSHSSSINKFDTAITESLKRINELIQKI